MTHPTQNRDRKEADRRAGRRCHARGLLEGTFEAINAQPQLLYDRDWPQWDFDVPGKIVNMPFLTEQAKRNILGENARRVFHLWSVGAAEHDPQ